MRRKKNQKKKAANNYLHITLNRSHKVGVTLFNNSNFLLVGLGNPGFRYKRTRHNIGFRILDHLKQTNESSKPEKKRNYTFTHSNLGERDVILAKPLTYMNRSGEAVVELIQHFKIPHSNLLIIFDDFNLPFGKLRIRSKGSDGGHNGLASVIHELGSSDFPRLRVGIGKVNHTDTIKFVLSKFNKKEKKELPGLITLAADACMHFVAEGIYKTMNKIN